MVDVKAEGAILALLERHFPDDLILSEENSAARLLTRPGEAIYNDANGMVEGNHPFQIAWLDEAQREHMIREMIERPDFRRDSDSRMIVFEGRSRSTFRSRSGCAASIDT